ncbi:MAG: 16S rRNA (adenine(1518)-N(6)/adenine(1519)-N(6))-dimethyltransferase RsmA [Holosporaceae bacterium]|nr:16S rRNA (adenine(1518)-N(6)/adenine(1519)-N(6))-dimethyltransferase RsmA [Holosporaceae bacterium]
MLLTNDLTEITANLLFHMHPCATKKKFGQHFLFDAKINRKIVSLAGNLRDKVVVEVGPGPGGLTLEILKQAVKKIVLVEVDSHWRNVWNDLGVQFDKKVEIIGKDALLCDYKGISPHVIISNLPYNISTHLLCKLLTELNTFESLILTFQKEVADRLCARPATKAYGKLSVMAQHLAKIEKVFEIVPGSFLPAPKVKSTVLKITPHLNSRVWSDSFSTLLTYAFAHRRKIVAKTLTKFIKDPEQILRDLGYNANTRAEEISVEDYAKLHLCLDNRVFES